MRRRDSWRTHRARILYKKKSGFSRGAMDFDLDFTASPVESHRHRSRRPYEAFGLVLAHWSA